MYTTGGMCVARISVVVGDGKDVYDECVKISEGAYVWYVGLPHSVLSFLDRCSYYATGLQTLFSTRFSSITSVYSASSLRPLVDIRRSLDEFVSSEIILTGYALEDDLKTLRMIHRRNVDTSNVLRRPAEPPYRRTLRYFYVPFLPTTGLFSWGG